MLNECFQVQGGHGWYLFHLLKAVPELYLPQGVKHCLYDSLDAVSSRDVKDKKVALDYPKIWRLSRIFELLSLFWIWSFLG